MLFKNIYVEEMYNIVKTLYKNLYHIWIVWNIYAGNLGLVLSKIVE